MNFGAHSVYDVLARYR